MEPENPQIPFPQNQKELIKAHHDLWLSNDQTRAYFSNIEKRRQSLLSQAEDLAATPNLTENVEHMKNCLIMARTLKIEVINYAQKLECITRS